MFLKKLRVAGFKCFPEDRPFEVEFSQGLNILVGENGSGKSAIVDSIRLILGEDEYGRFGIDESSFHRPFEKNTQSGSAANIEISCIFEPCREEEKIAFLPWLNEKDKIQLNFMVESKLTPRGYYKGKRWGGVSRSSIFEYSLLEAVQCIYLPPLRDAERKLVDVRGSRLSRLLKNLHRDELESAKKLGKRTQLEKVFDTFYQKVTVEDELIRKANALIRKQLMDALGIVFAQDISISFSESDFSRIVESLRLLFFPHWDKEGSTFVFRELNENSLGYNNLIYLATILAELEEVATNETLYRVLLIEEPEAHLHPQLQTRLLDYLEEVAEKQDIQIIVTSHSPTLTSAVSIDRIGVLTIEHNQDKCFTPLAKCQLSSVSKAFLDRWLDITKSVLLFSKGIILVEGISEAMLVPELAKLVLKARKGLPSSLEEAGVSVINMQGVFFKHFLPLFSDVDLIEGKPVRGTYLNIKCAILTDGDPDKDVYPLPDDPIDGENPSAALSSVLEENSKTCRLYFNMKTLEYDLAMTKGNLNTMIKAFLELLTTCGSTERRFSNYYSIDWSKEENGKKREVSKELLKALKSQKIAKGLYAQHLSELIKKGASFFVPEYIEKAVLWAVSKW